MTPSPTIPRFDDTLNPVGRLQPPGDYSELATESVIDALPGVVGWINDAVAWVTRELGHEINVVGWITEAVGGDWSDLLVQADVWNNLSWASYDLDVNLVSGMAMLNPYWDGNAAQAFQAHMDRWHTALKQHRDVCAVVRDTLKQLASVTKEPIQALIDMIELLISILGSGGPVAAVFRAWDVADGVINTYRVFNAVKSAIQAAISLFQAAEAQGVGGQNPETKVDVPDVGYGGPTSPGTM
jgi:hypothetical protein